MQVEVADKELVSTTLSPNINFRAPLAAGTKEGHFITHDGVETHIGDIIVRLVTIAPTHHCFVQNYILVARVINDSPEEFYDFYHWLAVSPQYKGKELTPADTREKTIVEDGKLFVESFYYDMQGNVVSRKVPVTSGQAVIPNKA